MSPASQGPVRATSLKDLGSITMAVFVLAKNKKPLMPCSERRARVLLKRQRAVVVKMHPFTIRLKDRKEGEFQPLRLSIDPGSKITGIALSREHHSQSEGKTVSFVLFLAELVHRGQAIRDALASRASFRRARRNRKTRYRTPRFLHRTKPKGWLAPSLRHRVNTLMAWVRRLLRLAPITGLSQELVRFDTQALVHPEIKGVEYQKGTLAGYEVREYLLEKWGRQCTYCEVQNVPLELDHVRPRSRGGSNQVSNLVPACHACNQSKGNQEVERFLERKTKVLARILEQLKRPLKDAAAVNSTRWAILRLSKKLNYLLRSVQEEEPNLIELNLGYLNLMHGMRPVLESEQE